MKAKDELRTISYQRIPLLEINGISFEIEGGALMIWIKSVRI